MNKDTVIALAREAGLEILSLDGEDEVGCGDGHHIQTDLIERFAALVAEHKEKEMQERIDALFALYEQACQQRDQLMDMQRAQIAAMRGRTQ